jgi:hypothetical protein
MKTDKLTADEIKHLIFYGKTEDKSIVIDEENKQLDYAITQMFLWLKESNRFDAEGVERILWKRIGLIASLTSQPVTEERDLHLEIDVLQKTCTKMYRLGRDSAKDSEEFMNKALAILQEGKSVLSLPKDTEAKQEAPVKDTEVKEEGKEAIEFAEWAKDKGWSFDVWGDRKWHNKANTHFQTTESKYLYTLFLKEKGQPNG